jgi:hypothetical protein
LGKRERERGRARERETEWNRQWRGRSRASERETIMCPRECYSYLREICASVWKWDLLIDFQFDCLTIQSPKYASSEWKRE